MKVTFEYETPQVAPYYGKIFVNDAHWFNFWTNPEDEMLREGSKKFCLNRDGLAIKNDFPVAGFFDDINEAIQFIKDELTEKLDYLPPGCPSDFNED